jgi:hypothetical protein
MSKKSFYTECPRCGSRCFEQLSDYAHCANCLHFEDRNEDLESCFYKAVRTERSATSQTKQEEFEVQTQTDEKFAS